MFSHEEKKKIAQAIEDVIRSINHPEMDNERIRFHLHVEGKESWSWADITENRPEHQRDEKSWNEHARHVLKSPEN